MTELKTLKDLKEKIKGWTYSTDDEILDVLKLIKTEAIKWVKEYGQYRMLLGKKVYGGNMRRFMEFHNITEEDLRNDRT